MENLFASNFTFQQHNVFKWALIKQTSVHFIYYMQTEIEIMSEGFQCIKH